MILFTDGLSELSAPDGQQFGEAGVIALVAGLPPGAPLADLLSKLAVYHGNQEFPDDITLVEISGGKGPVQP